MSHGSDNNFLILCDDASKEARQNQRVHNITLGKGSGQVRYILKELRELLEGNGSPVMLDLLEIATFVYVAGQLTRRGGEKELEYGHKWYRHLEFVVPVREVDVWEDNKELLENLLEFVDGSKYIFNFISKRAEAPAYFEFTDGPTTQMDFTEVVLLSGGLDSFTGAIEGTLDLKKKVLYVSHRSDSKMTKLQRNVFNYLSDNAQTGAKPGHLPIRINKGGGYVTKDTNQRSRSFLFAALGAVAADSLDLDEVKFYENGIVSCNLPFDGQTYQAQRTRSTHPKFLGEMSELVSNLLGRTFRFENPYFNRTRAEVVERLRDFGHRSGIGITRSCAKSRYQGGKRHDGVCSQCVGRRFATLASGCLENDPWKEYKVNCFVEELGKTLERAVVYGFEGMAEEVGKMTEVSHFINRFSSDLTEVVNHLSHVGRGEGMNAIFMLYRRHAKAVRKVMLAQMEENLEAYHDGKLPQNCLLSASYRKDIMANFKDVGAKAAAKKRGHGKLDAEVRNRLAGNLNLTAVKLAEDIGDTSPDSIRQTKPWENREKNQKK